MEFKAVIFDMDGLIVDTEIIEHRSFELLLKEYGREPKPYLNGLIHPIGVAGSTYYENFKKSYELEDDYETMIEKKRFFFQEILTKEELKALPGLTELLDILKKEKCKIGLASNRKEKFIHLILEKLNIKEYFDMIVGPGENRKHKPAPDIYLHTAGELGVKPEECVVLEDTEVGIISAKVAGMKAIAVPNVYTKDHNFERADLVVKSLSDINIEVLKSL